MWRSHRFSWVSPNLTPHSPLLNGWRRGGGCCFKSDQIFSSFNSQTPHQIGFFKSHLDKCVCVNLGQNVHVFKWLVCSRQPAAWKTLDPLKLCRKEGNSAGSGTSGAPRVSSPTMIYETHGSCCHPIRFFKEHNFRSDSGSQKELDAFRSKMVLYKIHRHHYHPHRRNRTRLQQGWCSHWINHIYRHKSSTKLVAG